jgi:tetratricopeptide (TPR) repeat protein
MELQTILPGALIVVTVGVDLLGLFKERFFSEKTPRWLFFLMSVLPLVGAALQFYQNGVARDTREIAAEMTEGVTLRSDPRTLTGEQKVRFEELADRMETSRPGQAPLFTAPRISVETYYKVALLEFNQRRFDKAIQLAHAILEVDEGNLQATGLLLLAYQYQAQDYVEAGKPKEAEAVLAKAMALKPTVENSPDARLLMELGFCYKSLGQAADQRKDAEASQKNWGEAEALFSTALLMDENDLGALIGMGNVLDRKGQLVEAVAHYDKAIGIHPDLATPYYDGAIALEKLMAADSARRNEYRLKAIEYWKNAVRKGRGNPLFSSDDLVGATKRVKWLESLAP